VFKALSYHCVVAQIRSTREAHTTLAIINRIGEIVGYVLLSSLVCTIYVSVNVDTRLDITDEDDDEDNNIPHSPLPRRGSFVFFGRRVAPVYSSIPLQSSTNTEIRHCPSVKIISQKKLEQGLAPKTTKERAAEPAQSVCIEVSSARDLTDSVSDTCLFSAHQGSDSLIPIRPSSLTLCLNNETLSVVDNKEVEDNSDLTRQDFPSSLIKPERCIRIRTRNQLQTKPRSISL